MVWPINDVVALVENLIGVATSDPLSAILVAVGGLLMTVSIGYFGVLTLGALLDLVTPESPGRRPPQQG